MTSLRYSRFATAGHYQWATRRGATACSSVRISPPASEGRRRLRFPLIATPSLTLCAGVGKPLTLALHSLPAGVARKLRVPLKNHRRVMTHSCTGAGTWRPVRRQRTSTPASTFSPVATMNSSRTDSYSLYEACDIGFHPGISFLPTPRVVGAAGKTASVLADIPPDHEGGSQASVNLAHARVCPLACRLKNACLRLPAARQVINGVKGARQGDP